jgi:hypothetical protein
MSTQAGSSKAAAQSPERRAQVSNIVLYGGAAASGMRNNLMVNSALVIEAPEGEENPTLYVIPPNGVPHVQRNVPYSATLTANCWTWPPTSGR